MTRDDKSLDGRMQALLKPESHTEDKMTPSDILPSADEEAALNLLKKRGWKVTRDTVYKKRTFEVDEEIHRAFRMLQERLGLKVKDAFNEALRDWIIKHSKNST